MRVSRELNEFTTGTYYLDKYPTLINIIQKENNVLVRRSTIQHILLNRTYKPLIFESAMYYYLRDDYFKEVIVISTLTGFVVLTVDELKAL